LSAHWAACEFLLLIAARLSYVVHIGDSVTGRRRLREPPICSRPNSGVGAMDQATIFLRQAPFDRRTVAMLCCVLEDGWAEIAVRCERRRISDNTGRMNLADTILALAKAGQRNPDVLKLYAVSGAHVLLGPTATD
jgi:hypothetical protein